MIIDRFHREIKKMSKRANTCILHYRGLANATLKVTLRGEFYYTLSLQIRDARTRIAGEKSFSLYESSVLAPLNHLGACLRSSCGCVIFRRGRISYRPSAVERDVRWGRELYFKKSMWHTGAQFIAERSSHPRESRESSRWGRNPFPTSGGQRGQTLCVSVCPFSSLSLSSSLFLSVWDSPFRANPAKWRGCRQPNNQTINHRRGGRFALAGVPFTSPVNRASCRISTSKHTRQLWRLVKPTNPRSWRTVFHGRRSLGTR